MTEPLVCAVMLTRDRPEMTMRAVSSFRAQTYERKLLLVLDGGNDIALRNSLDWHDEEWYATDSVTDSIGELRNKANGCANSDIICHFDSDDISHPSRIAEQVDLLQRTGAECAGYYDGLFWDTRARESHVNCDCGFCDQNHASRNEAWVFRHTDPRYVLGSSMCYLRSAWERRPFPDVNVGEDLGWLFHADQTPAVKTVGVSSLTPGGEPRMVYRIHGGNTSNSYSAEAMARDYWKRHPEWDDYCRGVCDIR